MKKILSLFALLASMTASATVTVTPLSVDYPNKKVTFSVSWTGSPANNRVWVWIDLSPITGTSPGTFKKAEISEATATAGSIETVSGNTRGFYVTTNPSTVTATLDNASGKFNWCVYGSDAPPNVTLDKGTYTFKGTTNFIVSNPPLTLTTETIAKANLSATTSTTFTDATGCPGIGSLYCPYTGSDLYMDATHLCQQRAGGAKNWEAWIKDTRDNELYRIVLMPDENWWLAQNVKYANTGLEITELSECTKDKCGRWYTGVQSSGSWGGTSGYGANKQGICPSNWILPVMSTYKTLYNSVSNTQIIVAQRLRAIDSYCSGGNDYYGWASDVALVARHAPKHRYGDVHSTNDYDLGCGAGVDYCGYDCYECDYIWVGEQCRNLGYYTVVRCFRQL